MYPGQKWDTYLLLCSLLPLFFILRWSVLCPVAFEILFLCLCVLNLMFLVWFFFPYSLNCVAFYSFFVDLLSSSSRPYILIPSRQPRNLSIYQFHFCVSIYLVYGPYF